MKLICAAMLSVFATAALAAEDTKTRTYSKELGAAMASAVCDAKTQPTSQIGADGSVSNIYDASTEDLHRCQYISEMNSSGCVQAGNCQSYEVWTRANQAISPALPRDAFLASLMARKATAQELAGSDQAVSNFGEEAQSDQQLLDAAKSRLLAVAKPIGEGLFMLDSSGCVWWVGEADGFVKTMRPLNADNTPICADTAQPN